jgi:hypothetical protein
MGSDPGGGEEVRGASGRPAVGKRLIRLAVVGAVAIVAVVLLVPQIRDLADTDGDENGIPEGLDVFRAASNGTDVYGIGGELDGETAYPKVFVFDEGEWKPATTPADATAMGDIAISDQRIAVAGMADRRAAIWTATVPDLEWEMEDVDAPLAELRGIAITDSTIVAVGSVLDAENEPLVLVRTSAGWETPSLPGERAVPMAIVATPDGFVVAGSAGGAPAMWNSPDGLTWTPEKIDGGKGTIYALAANGTAVMGIGTNDRAFVAFAFGGSGRLIVPMPRDDAGETAFAIAANGDAEWIVVGQDIDVGDVPHAIKWTGDIGGHEWTLDERVAADRLTDVVVVEGKPFGVGSLQRGGRLTPVLIPL